MSQIEFSVTLASDPYRSAAIHVAPHLTPLVASILDHWINVDISVLFSLYLGLLITGMLICQFARWLDVTSGVIGEFGDAPLSRLSILLHDDWSLILIFRLDLGSISRPSSGDPLQRKARSPRIFLKVLNEWAKFSRHLENFGRETITYRDPMRTTGWLLTTDRLVFGWTRSDARQKEKENVRGRRSTRWTSEDTKESGRVHAGLQRRLYGGSGWWNTSFDWRIVPGCTWAYHRINLGKKAGYILSEYWTLRKKLIHTCVLKYLFSTWENMESQIHAGAKRERGKRCRKYKISIDQFSRVKSWYFLDVRLYRFYEFFDDKISQAIWFNIAYI